MKMKIFIAILSLVAVSLAAISAIPPWRNAFREKFLSSQRNILAKIETQLTSSKDEYTLLKIQTRDQIFVEVYKRAEGDLTSEYSGRISLEEKKDAFFNFQGHATNLAVNDIDADGTKEILIPTYDSEMNPRLNIYKLNPDSQSFDRVKQEAISP